MALTEEMLWEQRDGSELNGPRYMPIKAAVTIINGSIVGHAAGSRYVKKVEAGDGTTFVVIGVHTLCPGIRNNASGANGAFTIPVYDGVWGPFAISEISAVTADDVDALIFFEDDCTISKTNQTNTLPGGGVLHSVDSDGAFVRFGK
jgi:hypothetical protein